MPKDKHVTILIPTIFDSRYTIELCLETIRKYTRYPYIIIVGNHGVDAQTLDFLKSQKDIQIKDIPKEEAPEDFLSKLVETDYFIFLHDDIQILNPRWLDNRVKNLVKNSKNAIVGEIVTNFHYDWKGRVSALFNKKYRRFFTLGLLVKTKVANELNLQWGKVKGKFDTGGFAYQQFATQNYYRFVRYPMKNDIKHFGEMSWPLRKLYNNDTVPNLEKLLENRNKKLEMIKDILSNKSY